jgi:hypothetical protein
MGVLFATITNSHGAIHYRTLASRQTWSAFRYPAMARAYKAMSPASVGLNPQASK